MAESRWMQRLESVRRASFTGRRLERDLFANMLTADEIPYLLLYLYGPGGIGKTTLLRQFVHLGKEAGAETIYLDSRTIDPSPAIFMAILQGRLGLEPSTPPWEYWSERRERQILLLDTFELLRPLNTWLREQFMPMLPQNVFVVLAGRTPPTAGWREDPAWQLLMRAIPLGNLTREETGAYLTHRGLPQADQEIAWQFTRGHPLALSLIADLYSHQSEMTLSPSEVTDVVGMLVARLARDAPGPSYRDALEASALVRVTNESLLAALLDTDDTHDIFAWLRELSLMDVEAGGLFPHDLAREALARDVRWRKPDWFALMHKRARGYYLGRLKELDSREQRRMLFDYIFLHRDNPMVSPYFEWQASGVVFTDRIQSTDLPEVLKMISRHEGEVAAGIAEYWLERQPDGVSVIRHSAGDVAGVLIKVTVEATTPEDRARDPAVAAAWEFLRRHAPLRESETATYFRFWMDSDQYQGVSPVQSRVFLNMVQHYLTTPGLAYTFISCAEPDFWKTVFSYADLSRTPGLDFRLRDRHWGVYMRDWRASPALAWLELMGDRELSSELSGTTSESEQVMIMSELDFAAAVREALRHLNDPLILQSNPLLQSRLFARFQPDIPTTFLRELILDEVNALQRTPKQRKLHRALYHVYIQPAPSQEAAAELLDVPFSTFRRHLRQGVQMVSDSLWQQEIA